MFFIPPAVSYQYHYHAMDMGLTPGPRSRRREIETVLSKHFDFEVALADSPVSFDSFVYSMLETDSSC